MFKASHMSNIFYRLRWKGSSD